MHLADALPRNGARWVTDNEIVFSQFNKGLMKISDDGKNLHAIPEGSSSQGNEYGYPQILPDGKSVLYQSNPRASGVTASMIMVESLETGIEKELFTGSMPQYVSTGHIIYASGSNPNNLYAVAFDLRNLAVKGDPVLLANNVRNYAVSDSGVLAYIPGSGTETSSLANLFWVNFKGKEEKIDYPADTYAFPSVSPNGTQIAVGVGTSSNADIWILDLVRKNRMQWTRNPGPDFAPLWTGDGKRIVFSSGSKGGLCRKKSDGSGEEELLFSFPDGMPLAWSWADNGNTLAVTRLSQNPPGFDFGVLPMEGDREWKPLLQETHYERQPQISPDGHWIAYASNEEGKLEVYIRPFPEVGEARRKVSIDGGENPLWSPDGGELYYRNKGAVLAVTVKTDPELWLEAPRILFRGPYLQVGSSVGTSWDIHPDGKRFLMKKPASVEGEETSVEFPRKINIILNWFEELKEKVPVN